MLSNKFIRLLFILSIFITTETVSAESVLVAVAANFTKPMEEIAAEFTKETGHQTELSFGSSGKFVAQIENGAPFQIIFIRR